MDEQALRDYLTRLRALFAQLEASKTATGQVREDRTMRPGGRLGPSAPGQDRAVELSIELELRLHEFVCDAKRHITPAQSIPCQWPHMLDWLRFHSQAVAELDPYFVDALADELRYQTKKIDALLNPTAPPVNRPEPWQPSGQVIAAARAHGYRVTAGQLRQLACRGVIETRELGTRNGYQTSQVIAYLKGS